METLCSDCNYPLESIDDGNCPLCGRYSMNEGDYHSGPDGYEPNTAYPETHYGSFDFGDDRIYDYDEDEYQ